MRKEGMSIREAESVLGLGIDGAPYTASDFSSAYRAKAKSAHPDMGGSDDEMARVNQAHERLSPLFDGKPDGYARTPAPTATGKPNVVYADGVIIDLDDIFDMADDIIMTWSTQNTDSRTDQGSVSKPPETSKGGVSEDGKKSTPARPKGFRYNLARALWSLRHLPYGLAVFVFIEWQALTRDRPLNNMFDSIPNMVDLLFEVVVLAPLLGIAARVIVRGVLAWVCRKIGGEETGSD